jgi:hypothetical protein
MSDNETATVEEAQSDAPLPTSDETTQASPDATPEESDSDFDSLLTQFDTETKAHSEAEEIITQATAGSGPDPLDELLREASANDPANANNVALDASHAELAAMRQKEWQRNEEAEFGQFASDLINRMPETLPNAAEYVRDKLLSRATMDAEVRAAWELRKIPPEEAKQERLRCEVAWDVLMRDQSGDPRKAQAMQVIQRRYAIANAALTSKSVLAKLQNDMIRDARRFAERIPDPEASFDRELVAQAVRSASGTAPAEPPPDVAHMSDKELREYKRSLWGGIGGSR